MSDRVPTIGAASRSPPRATHTLSTQLIWPPRWATGRQTNHALRTTFTGHTGSALAVACSVLNGRPVAITGSHDMTARVWDLATGEEITVFARHTKVGSVACSVLDGRPVAVTGGYDGSAPVWDLASGEEITVSPATPTRWLRSRAACLTVGLSLSPAATI